METFDVIVILSMLGLTGLVGITLGCIVSTLFYRRASAS